MKQIIHIAIAQLLLAISAYISVTLPISEKGIPFTAQSLVVFILAGLLRPKDFFIAITSYLILGIAGAPVFAEGSSGWSKVAGASGGFLYGFMFSGLLISFLLSKAQRKKLYIILVIMLIGTLVLFTFGLGHLSMKFGWTKALQYGLYPFWKMALVKAFLAGLVVFVINSFVVDKIKA